MQSQASPNPMEKVLARVLELAPVKAPAVEAVREMAWELERVLGPAPAQTPVCWTLITKRLK